MNPQRHGVFEARVPAIPMSVALARRMVADQLGRWGLDSTTNLVEVIVLAASELVTNVVQHAVSRSPFADLALSLDDRCVELRVHDRHPSLPTVLARSPSEGLGGRGLAILAALCAEAGGDVRVIPDGGGTGKSVAVRVPLDDREGSGPRPVRGTESLSEDRVLCAAAVGAGGRNEPLVPAGWRDPRRRAAAPGRRAVQSQVRQGDR